MRIKLAENLVQWPYLGIRCVESSGYTRISIFSAGFA
jgi:hypothetical protein